MPHHRRLIQIRRRTSQILQCPSELRRESGNGDVPRARQDGDRLEVEVRRGGFDPTGGGAGRSGTALLAIVDFFGDAGSDQAEEFDSRRGMSGERYRGLRGQLG
jgi:hypothetical protein